MPGRAPKFSDETALTVVMAARGYPGAVEKGTPIMGLEAAERVPGVSILHAATRREGETIVADGGRVLAVTALGRDVDRGASARLRRGGSAGLAGRLLPARHRLARDRTTTRELNGA